MSGSRRGSLAAVAVGLAAALATAGCGGDDAAAPDAGGPFIAMPQDFNGFCGWASAPAVSSGTPDAGTTDGGTDGVHSGLGPMTVYWNMLPPHGATEFPVRTIIVKSTQEADVTKRTVFAMTKRQMRNTGYNAGGADGWEWWSLQQAAGTDCSVVRLWRGIQPPLGETYADTTAGDCNTCHAGARANDFVWDKATQLSAF